MCIVLGNFKKFIDELFKALCLIQRHFYILFLLLFRHVRGFMEQAQIADYCCERGAYIMCQIHNNFIFLFFCLLCSLLAQQNRHFNLIELFLQFFQWLRQRYCMIVLLIDRLGRINYFIQIAPRLFPIEEAKKEALETLRPQVFLMALAQKENITVNDQEVEMAIYGMAMRAQQDYKKVSEAYHKSGLIYELRDRILADKALEMVYSKAKINEVPAVSLSEPKNAD